MRNHPSKIKIALLSLIEEMAGHAWLFLKNPQKDFSRKRKLGFADTVRILLSMGGKSTNGELIDYFSCAPNTPTASAFAQQRDKILPDALAFLLHEFTSQFSANKLYEGYRLLAADGTDMCLPYYPQDSLHHFQTAKDARGFNLLHCDCLYDLCNRIYIDVAHESRRSASERRTLINMIDHSPLSEKVILTADRGYESYNAFAHLQEKGWNYVIRVKDINSSGILSGLNLPKMDVFDTTVQIILTKKKTKQVKANRCLYKTLEKSSPFDYLDLHHNIYYPISLRVVRFQIADGVFECVVTNLPEATFSLEKIKQIYSLRWGIETAFRDLKNTIGLNLFHSKKTSFVIQEIYARFIMYNFCALIAAQVVIQQKGSKYLYQVNFSAAVSICRLFFRYSDNLSPPDIEALIGRYILPIRRNRKYPRCTKSATIGFHYRMA